jgi:hypothetical protein
MINMELIIVILTGGTFVVASLAFLSRVTDWLKKTIPVSFGFLLNEQITTELVLATGDPAKPVSLRFHNSGKTTLTGVVLDIRFLKPIVLSATSRAITYIPGKTMHGRTSDGSFYHYQHSELVIAGHDSMDFRVELNTEGQSPGTYQVMVTIYSTQQAYKYKKSTLSIVMQ